jgi:ATP/ADP translocase
LRLGGTRSPPHGGLISLPERGAAVSTVLWFLFAVLYLVILVTLGLTTLRKGHVFLFVIGIFLPFLWLIGAVIGPTPRVASAR